MFANYVDGSPGNVAFYGTYPPRGSHLARVLDCDDEPVAQVAGMRIHERRAQRLAASRCRAGAERDLALVP